MPTNNLLILEKTVFHGTAKDKLLKFVKCHDVILPYALCVECTISQEGEPPKEAKDPKRLLNRHLDLVKNGAYIGKSPARIVKEERARKAVIESLIDEEQTHIVREATLDEELDLEKERAKCERAIKPFLNVVRQFANQHYKSICKKGMKEKFRQEMNNGDLMKRLGLWLKAAEEMKDVIFDTFTASGSKTVFKDGWEWQMLRLGIAWGTELACKRNNSGPDFENCDITNDIYDIEYVSHLSQASGLLSIDNKLVRPLAMAAYPEKDVYGSINDVPYRYCVCEHVVTE